MMKLYLNMSAHKRAEAIALSERLAEKRIEVCSTWMYYPDLEEGKDLKASARVRAEITDREIATAAAMLTWVHAPVTDHEVFVRVGQAIEFHQPMVWLIDPDLMMPDSQRAGMRVAADLGEAIEILSLWESKLAHPKGPIPPEYGRRAIWAYVLHQEGLPIPGLTEGPRPL